MARFTMIADDSYYCVVDTKGSNRVIARCSGWNRHADATTILDALNEREDRFQKMFALMKECEQ